MNESRFIYYTLLLNALRSSAGYSLAVQPHGHSRELTDEQKTRAMVARAEVLLAQARKRLAGRFAHADVSPWMRPEFFPTFDTSFAATLAADFKIPLLRVPFESRFLQELRLMDAAERLALADLFEAAWYQWLPGGSSLADVFAAYDMPLKPANS